MWVTPWKRSVTSSVGVPPKQAYPSSSFTSLTDRKWRKKGASIPQRNAPCARFRAPARAHTAALMCEQRTLCGSCLEPSPSMRQVVCLPLRRKSARALSSPPNLCVSYSPNSRSRAMTNAKRFYDSTQQLPEPTPEEAQALAAREVKRAERAAQAAHELAKLRRLLEHYARYREDNCSKHEWENVQQKRKEAYVRKAQLELEFKTALEGDKNLPMVRPTLASTLDNIVREIERFLVIDHDDALIIALWIVQTHVFLLE